MIFCFHEECMLHSPMIINRFFDSRCIRFTHLTSNFWIATRWRMCLNESVKIKAAHNYDYYRATIVDSKLSSSALSKDKTLRGTLWIYKSASGASCRVIQLNCRIWESSWNFRELCAQRSFPKRSRCFPSKRSNSRYVPARAFAWKLLAITIAGSGSWKQRIHTSVQAVMADVIFTDETERLSHREKRASNVLQKRASRYFAIDDSTIWGNSRESFYSMLARARLWTKEPRAATFVSMETRK